MNTTAGETFRAIVDVLTSVPLDPTSTVCAIALLVVAAMTWRIIIAARDDPRARPRRTRRPPRRTVPAAPPLTPPRRTPIR